MSTRSIIVVTGKGKYNQEQTIRCYKHSDGYPMGVLGLLSETLVECNKMIRAERKARGKQLSDCCTLNVAFFIGKLIGHATSWYGMGVEIEEEFASGFSVEQLGRQSDLEWIYVLDLSNGVLNIYGGGYSGQLPQKAYERGLVDPLSYANQLSPEYQEQERKDIAEELAKLAKLKIVVNKK